ncbi:MAG: hypothetical protein Q8K93_07005 [Reyranella sp.]|uniref:hypothetical protein n=1 Tax=Reyranella sp. TaxID=1929291 RepID=UPI00272EFF63|nr:hypothetical protein [Reyranella sp.]MDP1961932.1 hypothetical protein [Reyranella sp.]MDP2375752.1 hypothetical protein [Reyranella sp.]
MHLHLPTLDIVNVFSTLVAAGVSLLAWYLYRDAVALRSWAAALVLGSVGALLFSLRSPSTSAVVFVMADALCVASFATMWVSMRRFNGDRSTPLRMTIVASAITCVFVFLVTLSWQMGAALRAQSLLFSLFVGGLALATAWDTWRGGRQDGLQSRRIAALALAGIAAARLIRVGLLAFDWFDIMGPVTADVTWGYGMYFSIVCVLVVTFGLVLMAYEQQYIRQTDPYGA